MQAQELINHPRYFRLVYSNLKYEKQKEICRKMVTIEFKIYMKMGENELSKMH